MERPAYKRLWIRIKTAAKHRGLVVEISLEQTINLLEKQEYRCKLTGTQIGIATSSKGDAIGETTASLDRVDSAKGYTIDNIQWVHKDVNRMKWDLSQERFIEVCRMVVANAQT